MSTLPKQVEDVLAVEFPATCDLLALEEVEIAVCRLWMLLRTSNETYPKLFAVGRDTWRMRKNREAALRVLDLYMDTMLPVDYLQEPKYKKALYKWSKNCPLSRSGTLPSVLAFASSFVHTKSRTRLGEVFFFCYQWRMRNELSILKKTLREYFVTP